MFTKKKDNGAAASFATAYIADKNAQAKAVIAQAIAEIETAQDRAYATGMIELAYELQIITMNERAALKTKAYEVKIVKQ